MLNAAIIGYGGIAQAAHVPAYKTLEEKGKARLVAACDIDPAQFTKKLEINIGSAEDMPADIHAYTDLEEMLAKEPIDLIDICLPTYLHAQVAADMLRRGYHVQSEKPMARSFEDCQIMLEAAKGAKGRLMIGQCLRFSSLYAFLKDAIDNNTFGRPVSAVFRRLSGPPVWTWDNWMKNHENSGGCLLDMHIHDIDMARFLFGEPTTVSCVTKDIWSGDDIVHSHLLYDGLSVLAIGDWSQNGFMADYRVGFEKATVVCEGEKITVYPRGGDMWTPVLNNDNMYMLELEFLIDTILSGAENTVNPPESAAKTVKLIDTLRMSARDGGCAISL